MNPAAIYLQVSLPEYQVTWHRLSTELDAVWQSLIAFTSECRFYADWFSMPEFRSRFTNQVVYVIRDQNRMIGFSVEDISLQNGVNISFLCVHPEYRHKRIGSHCVKAAEIIAVNAREWQHLDIPNHVWVETNSADATQFFIACGFQSWERSPSGTFLRLRKLLVTPSPDDDQRLCGVLLDRAFRELSNTPPNGMGAQLCRIM